MNMMGEKSDSLELHACSGIVKISMQDFRSHRRDKLLLNTMSARTATYLYPV